MIVFVDMEHESARSKPWAEKLLAARASLTYRLEDLAGMHCMLVRYDRVDTDLLTGLNARALFLSGSSAAPEDYGDEINSLHQILAARTLPTFGFCGGMQAMVESEGISLIPLAEGATERGYTSVDLTGDHPMLDGLGPSEIVRHAHSFQAPEAPAGYDVIASTDLTSIQMIVDDENKLVGTQFHPEYFTDEHPAGKTMIENFMKWAL